VSFAPQCGRDYRPNNSERGARTDRSSRSCHAGEKAGNETHNYVRLDKNHKPAGVFRQGTPVADDVRVFMEADPGSFISITPHLSGRFCDISAHGYETSEGWLIDLFTPDAEPVRWAVPMSH
jgi:protease II